MDVEGTELQCLDDWINSGKTVYAAESQCGNFGNLLSGTFGKNFVKATFLLS